MMDDEKTRFAPRKFGVAAKTEIMDVPPRMTGYLQAVIPDGSVQPAPNPAPPAAPRLPQPRAGVPGQARGRATAIACVAPPDFDPRATRMAIPPLPNQRIPSEMPVELTTGEIVRGPHTRLARASRHARPMPAASSLPTSYLEPAKPPPRPPTIDAAPRPCGPAAWRLRLQQKGARPALLAGVAIVLIAFVLLMPLSSPSANANPEAMVAEAASSETAEEEPRTPEQEARRSPSWKATSADRKESKRQEEELSDFDKEPKQTRAPAPGKAARASERPEGTKPQTASASASEEAAAAMLLSGRRAEALQLYQELALGDSSSPGIEAMVVVLSQKVEVQ